MTTPPFQEIIKTLATEKGRVSKEKNKPYTIGIGLGLSLNTSHPYIVGITEEIIKKAGLLTWGHRLFTPSQIIDPVVSIKRLTITVAGPYRICAGFPFHS